MTRIANLDPSEMTEEQKAIHADIVASRGGIRGPQGIWLRRPGLSDPAQKLGAFCRFATTLEQKLVEMTVIMTAAHFKAQYEWYAHAKLALEAGLDAGIVSALQTGQRPQAMGERERVIFEFCTDLLEDNRLDDATYGLAVKTFGEDTVVEIVAILGYYAMVSYTLNAFDVSLPPNVPLPFFEP